MASADVIIIGMTCSFLKNTLMGATYVSHEEYEDLLAQLVGAYDQMIEDGMALHRHEIYEGPSPGVIEHWTVNGTPLWLTLTKGTQADWCNQMGLMMGHMLEQVCTAAISLKRAISKKRHSKQQIDSMLMPLLQHAIREFISPSSSPCHMDAFKSAHFTFDEETRRYTLVNSPSLADAVQ